MSSPKVVIIGATGAHGREIIKGLLESPTKFVSFGFSPV